MGFGTYSPIERKRIAGGIAFILLVLSIPVSLVITGYRWLEKEEENEKEQIKQGQTWAIGEIKSDPTASELTQTVAREFLVHADFDSDSTHWEAEPTGTGVCTTQIGSPTALNILRAGV